MKRKFTPPRDCGSVSAGASSSSGSQALSLQDSERPKQLNESVYAFHEPPVGRLEIVFFHGLHWGTDSARAYVEAWTSSVDSQDIFWPQKWLSEDFDEARILSVSYDSSVTRTGREGNIDLSCIGENLIQNLTDRRAMVGQMEKCPLILVGQDLGGLIIKAICQKAYEERDRFLEYQRFLSNVKAVLFYCTPHCGIDNLPSHFDSPLARKFQIYDEEIARLNHNFSTLRKEKQWVCHGIGMASMSPQGAKHVEIKLASRLRIKQFVKSMRVKVHMGTVQQFVAWMIGRSRLEVLEGSSRYDIDKYYTVAAGPDIQSVCRPVSRKAIGYTYLVDLIEIGLKPSPLEPAIRSCLRFGNDKYTYPEGTVGLEKKVPEVLSIFQDIGEKNQPRAILLYGMGGIGKTMLGSEVCKKARIPIDYRYAEVEVGGQPSNASICGLQALIYGQLSGSTPPTISMFKQGQEQLQDLSKTFTNPVLLFIDNVFEEEDLSRLLPDSLGLPDGSCIIVTSRDALVLTALEKIATPCHPYEVKKLEELESKTLFDDVLGGCPAGKEQLSSAILGKCDGWPLALTLVGGYLKRRKDDPDAWKETLVCLRKCEPISSRSEGDMIKILRWTYERLDKRAQNLFLDACLLRNQPWEFLESLGRPIALDCLQDLSLVKKREWKTSIYKFSSGSIKIHDIFFDYGRLRTPLSPMTRVCIESDRREKRAEKTSFLQNDVEGSCRHVEGLIVKERDELVLATKLDEMHQTLRILILDNRELEGECVEVPQNLQICWTRWCQFPYNGLSNLNKLSVLCISGDVRFDFTTVQFPGSLKILYLLNVQSLQFSLDAFELCTGLHTVFIQSCNALTELPASFSSLEKLQVLCLDFNRKLHTLPEDFGQLKSLETLYVGNLATELPSGVSALPSLRTLSVENGPWLSIDFHLSLLTRLEDLNCEMDIGPQLLHEVGSLKKLRNLNLESCNRVEQLPEDFCELTSLETLALQNCRELTKLPAGFGELQRLSMLTLHECESLSGLPDGFSKLSSLRKLSMTNCTSLKRLPRGFCGLPLDELELDKCESLEQLPNEFSKLTSLKELYLRGCLSLENLPEGFTDLQSLACLSLSACENLCRLPSDFSNLKSLRRLSLDVCISLKDLPLGFAHLPNLQHLSLRGCGRLGRLPSDFGDLRALECCFLNDCSDLEPLLKKDEQFADRLNGMDLEALSEEDEQFMTRLIFICSVFALPTLAFVEVEGCNDLLQAFHTCRHYSSQLASALALVKVEGYSPLLQVLRHHVLVPREKGPWY